MRQPPYKKLSIAVAVGLLSNTPLGLADVDYEIKEGDTLWQVSDDHYNNPRKWPEIWHNNEGKIKNPDLIYKGEHIKVPSAKVAQQSQVTHPVQSSTASKYNARIDILGKVGNRRSIGHFSILAPVLQNDNNIFFFNLIGMADTRKAFEGNFGLGYRHLMNSTMIGAYGFYDIRRTQFKNTFHQITIGGELFIDNLEFRANVYLPVSNRKPTRDQDDFRQLAGPHTRVAWVNIQRFEIPMNGFDVEAGATVPNYENISGHVAYYHFSGKNTRPINGIRARAAFQVFPWLAINGEVNYDKVRRTNAYVGATLTYRFGERKAHNQLSLLEKKMTLMPVRDIDIVSEEQDEQERDVTINGITDVASNEGLVTHNKRTNTYDRFGANTPTKIRVVQGDQKKSDGTAAQMTEQGVYDPINHVDQLAAIRTNMPESIRTAFQSLCQQTVHNAGIVLADAIHRYQTGEITEAEYQRRINNLDFAALRARLGELTNGSRLTTALNELAQIQAAQNPVPGADPEPQDDDGLEPQSDDNLEPQSDDELEPQSDDNLEPQSDDNLEPQSDDNLEPQSDDGLEPQSDDGLEPQSDDNLEPQSDDNLEPQSDDGLEPQSDDNLEPQSDDNLEPQSDDGLEPQSDDNLEPQSDDGLEPQSDSDDEQQPNVVPAAPPVPQDFVVPQHSNVGPVPIEPHDANDGDVNHLAQLDLDVEQAIPSEDPLAGSSPVIAVGNNDDLSSLASTESEEDNESLGSTDEYTLNVSPAGPSNESEAGSVPVFSSPSQQGQGPANPLSSFMTNGTGNGAANESGDDNGDVDRSVDDLHGDALFDDGGDDYNPADGL